MQPTPNVILETPADPNGVSSAALPLATEQIGANLKMNGRSNVLPPPPENIVAQALSWSSVNITWLAGDGSDRCYYRLRHPKTSQTYVLMQLSGDDAKQLKGDDYEWIKIGKLLHQHGIYAPQTVATIPDYAAIVIEDYGDTMMETAVLKALESGSSRAALAFYQKSFDILGRFLQIEQDGSSKWRQRAFDADRFDWELHFFRENFLENVLEWKFSNEEMTNFSRDSLRLANYLAENSKFFVHRDFHSRNVMVKNLDLAVIDFQDARLGPPTYDIVSLCFDSYIPLEFATREQLLQDGLRSLSQAHSRLSLQALEGEWRGMLLQRQLKAIGSFGYLTIKKNRGNYLRYLNPALDTLPESKINDGRWPFLSGPMLKEIAERWRKYEKSL